MDWIEDALAWLWAVIVQLFGDLAELLKDVVLYAIGAVMELVAIILEVIPTPSFLEGVSLDSLLDSVPVLGFFISQLRLVEALAIIGAAYGFRLIRLITTLGLW